MKLLKLPIIAALRWRIYYWQLRNTPPRGTTLKAVEFLKDTPKNLPVIDLGCGHGTDSLVYLRAGWQVIAVDKNKKGLQILKKRAEKEQLSTNLQLICEDFTTFDIPPCVAVNANFAFPFCKENRWDDFWQRINNGLVSGGVVAGQFFGVEDSWNKKGHRTLHFPEQKIHDLLKNFTIISWKEVKKIGKDDLNQSKFWHVYHVLAQKK